MLIAYSLQCIKTRREGGEGWVGGGREGREGREGGVLEGKEGKEGGGTGRGGEGRGGGEREETWIPNNLDTS